MPSAESKIMTSDHLVDYLHLTRRTIYKFIKNRTIPCAKVGGVWRFDKEEIDLWLKDRAKKHISEYEPEKKLRVLVVDDTPAVLDVLSEGIRTQMENTEVQTAVNGVQALMAVGKQKPDIMILDIEMPELNGIEVCKRLKENPETSDIFIIAVTGYAEYKEQVLAAGADEFMEKPLKPETIVTTINEMAKHIPVT
jgi:excisionase family DNA binding protein